MLTTDAFHAWCHRLQLASDTVERIAAIRSSPPVRRVTGRAGNVAGRYPSPKMQRTIQFESQHVELWAIYAMECDDAVAEYYDQPGRMPLRYRAVSGRHTTQWHTPDFFVLRHDSAGWEEWKPLHVTDAGPLSSDAIGAMALPPRGSLCGAAGADVSGPLVCRVSPPVYPEPEVFAGFLGA